MYVLSLDFLYNIMIKGVLRLKDLYLSYLYHRTMMSYNFLYHKKEEKIQPTTKTALK